MANPNRIPVLEKAVDILEYIGSHPGPVTRTELQQALGIPQATCYRVIATLVEKQWPCMASLQADWKKAV